MDILSHLLEQYFDRSKNNDASKGMIEGLMRTVIKWAPIALKQPDNYDARANLMWSATMALNGICLLYTSDAADDLLCVDLGGSPIIKKKKNIRALI